MNTRPRLRKRAPSGPSRPLAALSEFYLPRQVSPGPQSGSQVPFGTCEGDAYCIACGVKIHQAPPGNELLCLERVFMKCSG
ncbi:MAG: hypothetical protein ACI89E_001330 [Planctomycetota bacterium]|jgi:hypothetical protein